LEDDLRVLERPQSKSFKLGEMRNGVTENARENVGGLLEIERQVRDVSEVKESEACRSVIVVRNVERKSGNVAEIRAEEVRREGVEDEVSELPVGRVLGGVNGRIAELRAERSERSRDLVDAGSFVGVSEFQLVLDIHVHTDHHREDLPENVARQSEERRLT
jgi:hypothetical protein